MPADEKLSAKERREIRREERYEKKMARKERRRNAVKKGLKKTERAFDIKSFDSLKNDKPSDIRARAKAHIQAINDGESPVDDEPMVNQNIYILAGILIVITLIFAVLSVFL